MELVRASSRGQKSTRTSDSCHEASPRCARLPSDRHSPKRYHRRSRCSGCSDISSTTSGQEKATMSYADNHRRDSSDHTSTSWISPTASPSLTATASTSSHRTETAEGHPSTTTSPTRRSPSIRRNSIRRSHRRTEVTSMSSDVRRRRPYRSITETPSSLPCHTSPRRNGYSTRPTTTNANEASTSSRNGTPSLTCSSGSSWRRRPTTRRRSSRYGTR